MNKMFFLSAASFFVCSVAVGQDAPSEPILFLHEEISIDDVLTRSPQELEVQIARTSIRDYARAFAQEYVSIADTAPTRMISDMQNTIDQTVDNVCMIIEDELTKHQLSSIGQHRLDAVLKGALTKVGTQVPHAYVASKHLTQAVDEIVAATLQSNGKSLSTMPQDIRKEFADRKTGIINNLAGIVRERKTHRLSRTEIEDIVQKSFEGFIERVDHLHVQSWVNAELALLKATPPGAKGCSSIPANTDSKRLKQNVRFFNKK